MAHQFDYDPVDRIARCRMEGQVTDEELEEYYREAGQDPTVLQARAAILDLSNVTAFKVSSQMISELAGRAPALPNPSLPRIVIAPAPSVYGVARMFQLRGEVTRPNLHIVHTPEEAWAILGLKKEPQFAPYK